MVEQITIYKTDDGQQFKTREEAEKYEREAEPRKLASIIYSREAEDIAAVIIDRKSGPTLADAIERAGAIIQKQRLAARELRRERRNPDGAPAHSPIVPANDEIASPTRAEPQPAEAP